MINQKEITIDWISNVSKENKNADKILVEKVNILVLPIRKKIIIFTDFISTFLSKQRKKQLLLK